MFRKLYKEANNDIEVDKSLKKIHHRQDDKYK